MNFQTYIMIAAAVITLGLHLYMKYQDKRDNVSTANADTSTMSEPPEAEDDEPIIDIANPSLIGMYRDED